MAIELIKASQFVAKDKHGRVLSRANLQSGYWFAYTQYGKKRFADYQAVLAHFQTLANVHEIRATTAEVVVWRHGAN